VETPLFPWSWGERAGEPEEAMLAKGKKRVNGKSVLLCTIGEERGRKTTIMTTGHFGIKPLDARIYLKLKVTKI
jgi:hypothetical protein